MDNKTARQDLETVIRVEDLALGSMRKLRAIQDWLRAEAARNKEPASGQWLIQLRGDYLVTRGIWERPDHRGYTNDLSEAGRYSEAEARRSEEIAPDKYKAVRMPQPASVEAELLGGDVTTEFKRYKHAVITGAQRDKVEVDKNFSFADFHAGYRAGFWAPNPATRLQEVPDASFQDRVEPWLLQCFGATIAGDKDERNHRFLEEALELVQSLRCTAEEAHKLVDYVFSRPVGDPPQEVGGVNVTLAALCLANAMDMHKCGEAELARITQPEMVERIREKQKRKPSMSPLPGVYPDREEMTSSQASQESTHG
jgi:hypothetical protein